MHRIFNTLVALAPLHQKFTLLALQSRYIDTSKRVRIIYFMRRVDIVYALLITLYFSALVSPLMQGEV